MWSPNIISKGISLVRRKGVTTTGTIASRMLVDRIASQFGLFKEKSVMAKDWDVLLILDACRVDTLEEVASEYEFIPTHPSSRYSVGSATDVWMERTFDTTYRDELRDTAYITANPNSDANTPSQVFFHFEEVWQTNYDPELGTTPPRPVTDRAITIHRERSPDRLIVHYMQPHFPSIPEPLGFGIRKGATNPDEQEWIWGDGVPNGYTEDDLWQSYVENLRYVLDDVELFLKNIDAENVIISADHANAFGEWGLWGHPKHTLPVLRAVPWVETTASDTKSYYPDTEPIGEGDYTIEDKLRTLGYK